MCPELHTTDSQVSNWGQSQKDNFHEKGKLGLRFTHVNRSLEFFSKLINSKSCNLTRLPKRFLNPSLCCRLRSSFFARGKLQIEIFTAKSEKDKQYQKSFQVPGVSDASLQLFLSKSPIPYLSLSIFQQISCRSHFPTLVSGKRHGSHRSQRELALHSAEKECMTSNF